MNNKFLIFIIFIIIFIIGYITGCGTKEYLTVFNDYIGNKTIYLTTFIDNIEYYMMGVDTNTCSFKNDGDVKNTIIKFVLMTKDEYNNEIRKVEEIIPLNEEVIKPYFRIDKKDYIKEFNDILKMFDVNEYMISYIYKTIRPIGVKDGLIYCLTPKEYEGVKENKKNNTNVKVECELVDTGGNDGSVYIKCGGLYIGYDETKCADKFRIIRMYEIINDKVIKFRMKKDVVE